MICVKVFMSKGILKSEFTEISLVELSRNLISSTEWFYILNIQMRMSHGSLHWKSGHLLFICLYKHNVTKSTNISSLGDNLVVYSDTMKDSLSIIRHFWKFHFSKTFWSKYVTDIELTCGCCTYCTWGAVCCTYWG